MNFAKFVIVAFLMLAALNASKATVRLADDRGGRIGNYLDRFRALRSSHETIVIDGLCASACTMVLGAVSHDRICVTSQASHGFHAAWDAAADGREVTNLAATKMLYSMYPSAVKRWISARGGLTPRMIFLQGKELMGMYKPCYINAQTEQR